MQSLIPVICVLTHDLLVEDLRLLDAYNNVYIWLLINCRIISMIIVIVLILLLLLFANNCCLCVLKQDLLVEDVFLLDAYDNVYVWLGNEARHDEKTMAMDAALVSGHSQALVVLDQ